MKKAATIKKAVIYARVSSKEQEREGFSIPAQTKMAREYASKNNIKIVEEFVEAETAKKVGRAQFNKMLTYLKKHKDIKNILVEKTDRLYRNLKDYVLIDELDDIAIHFFKEGTILSSESKSQDKFMHGIRVLMAKNYIDNLSEEIKKGLKEKAEQGYYPFRAPFGYKNVILKSGKRIIQVDTETAPYIKRAFELYATGRQTYFSVAEQLTADGFRPNGHKCTYKNIERMLNNPFYMGAFNFNGRHYSDGQHEAIVSKELYFIVQRLLAQKCPSKPRKHDFAYTGLIKCLNCGCMLTGEIKKQKYIYYHCTNAKRLDTTKPSIREEKIEEKFKDFLKQFDVPHEVFEDLKNNIREYLNQGCEYIEQKNTEIKHRIDILNRRLSKLYDDRMDGIITDDFYYEKRDEWQKELDELLLTFEKTVSSNRTLIDNAEIIIELAKDAPLLYERQTKHEKARLMKLITIELLFDGENLLIKPHPAFLELLNLINRHKVERIYLQTNPLYYLTNLL